MREHFESLAVEITATLRGDELYTCTYNAEETDFVRLTRSAVRQAGSVSQKRLTLELINGRRHSSASIGLSGNLGLDRPRVRALVEDLRERLEIVPEDPHLLYAQEVNSSQHEALGELPSADQALDEVLATSRGRDLVGLWACGEMHHGFANSFGQRNWDSRSSFNLDWSFYHDADKAAKANYAGVAWDGAALARRAEHAAEQLEILKRPARRIDPGLYPVYLAPDAFAEIVNMLRMGGFSLRAHRTKTTPLLRMLEGAELSASITIREDTAGGVAPGFQSSGFLRPDEVRLIEAGRYADALVSPRSAVEYGVPTNGATSAEAPLSLDVAPGDLPRDRVLAELGTGVFVSNLWYLNYSDRSACRTTGMTRFATFWVENGVIQAPLSVMRFDETVLDTLGQNLVALTEEREFLLDSATYVDRSVASTRVPGALIKDFVFTL